MRPTQANIRRGFSLLELTVTMGLMATLITSVFVLLRTAQTTWYAHESDHDRLEAAHGVARHMVRQLRQAQEITALSAPSEESGSVTALMHDGSSYQWSRSGQQVDFAIDAASSLLARKISGLRLVGYKADGTTTTTTASEVQAVEIFVTVDLDRDIGVQKIVHTWVWLRNW